MKHEYYPEDYEPEENQPKAKVSTLLKSINNEREMHKYDSLLPLNNEILNCTSTKLFASPEALFKSFAHYLDYCEEFESNPTVPGFCIHMGIQKSSFKNYKTYPEYEGIMDFIDSYFEDYYQNKMLKDKSPTAALTVLVNKHNWRSSSQRDVAIDNRSLNVIYANATEDEITKALADVDAEIAKLATKDSL